MNAHLRSGILPLDGLTAGDEPASGGKAWNCARLAQAGFRVPDGLVVLAMATDADLEGLAAHPWLDGVPADAMFAVRSSGIGEDGVDQSFAGIHQTWLDVRRADLVAAVAACRASAHTAQALEYRRAKGLSTREIRMGVLVQRMIHPVAAGVAFTVNPVTGAADELVINSSWGLGEALVSGQVDPDEFVVAKADRALRWSRVGEKTGAAGDAQASLSADHVRELAGILLAIERHYGAPQDVEWCHDGAGFWIVQSRPVTSAAAAVGETEWTRANVAEVLPDLTSPQVLTLLEDLLNRAGGQAMGRLTAPELGPTVKTFCGRLYFNLAQIRRACALGGIAPAEMLRSMGHSDAIQPADEKAGPPAIGEVLSCAPDLVRMLWRHLRVAHVVRAQGERLQGHLRRLSPADAAALSDTEIWSLLDEWFVDAPECMQAVLVLSGVLFQEMPVRKACAKVGFPFERLVYPQLATGERSVSAQQAFDLLALAEAARREPAVVAYLGSEKPDWSGWRVALAGTAFVAEFERFLQAYGHRGRYESDWSLPRYREDPAPLFHALRAHLSDGSPRAAADIARRQEKESAEAWAAFSARLSPWQRRTMRPRVQRAMRTIKQYYLWREQVRSDMMRVVEVVRTLHLVLADRFVARGWLDRRDDYFLLLLSEIAPVIEGKTGAETLRGRAADRAAEMARRRAVAMPLLMRESQLAQLIRAAGVSERSADESRLTGYPVSGGCVEAEVVVVRDPGDFGRMKRGAILVAPATDPSWTPLFTLASGVIVEVGGVLSHASTIAREYGLPALANVKHATKRLRTGERVRLDAVRGVVVRLDQPAAVEVPGLVETN